MRWEDLLGVLLDILLYSMEDSRVSLTLAHKDVAAVAEKLTYIACFVAMVET